MAGKNWRGLSEEAARAAGVKASSSTFKNKQWVNPSRTLYITNIAPGTTTQDLENLFRHLEGFIALRRVRSMCFVDFEQKQQATTAMWKTNGHKFKPHHEGLLVSYDKDDDEDKGGWSVRKREEEKQRRQQVEATRSLYRCAACHHFCLKLARPLPSLPERRTDGSRVVSTTTDLVTLMAVKGGQKLIKREKGVERQFRYNCELCDVCIAYRPVPYEQDSKFIYVFPQAVADFHGPSSATAAVVTVDGNGAASLPAAVSSPPPLPLPPPPPFPPPPALLHPPPPAPGSTSPGAAPTSDASQGVAVHGGGRGEGVVEGNAASPSPTAYPQASGSDTVPSVVVTHVTQGSGGTEGDSGCEKEGLRNQRAGEEHPTDEAECEQVHAEQLQSSCSVEAANSETGAGAGVGAEGVVGKQGGTFGSAPAGAAAPGVAAAGGAAGGAPSILGPRPRTGLQ